jgi:hypothetical protein
MKWTDWLRLEILEAVDEFDTAKKELRKCKCFIVLKVLKLFTLDIQYEHTYCAPEYWPEKLTLLKHSLPWQAYDEAMENVKCVSFEPVQFEDPLSWPECQQDLAEIHKSDDNESQNIINQLLTNLFKLDCKRI